MPTVARIVIDAPLPLSADHRLLIVQSLKQIAKDYEKAEPHEREPECRHFAKLQRYDQIATHYIMESGPRTTS